jgi:spore coat polysaccharide biosynthesis predicted glycosyltransferase SpsG
LVIDDNALCDAYAGRFLLNPNLYAAPELYRGRAAGAELLLGPSYALLRSEFCAVARPAAARDSYKVALTLGGADPRGATAALASALLKALGPADLLRVIRGPAAEWAGSEIAVPALGPRLEVLEAPRDMAAAFRDLDLVVSSSGTTLLELAALGLPVVALQNVPGEARAAAAAEKMGFARDLGPVTELDPGNLQETVAALLADAGRRAAMSEIGRSVVDGRGAARVVAALMGPPP